MNIQEAGESSRPTHAGHPNHERKLPMKFRHKMMSVAAAVALVAGLGAAGAAPAVAADKVTGKTVISFKKDLAPVVKGIVVVPPAKKSTKPLQISFPVTGDEGIAVQHSGAIKIGTVEASNPQIVFGEKKVEVVFTVGDKEYPLFYIKKWKQTKDTKKQQVWRGFLHVTDNAEIVQLLNSAAGARVFEPGLGLGQIKTTLNTK